MDKAKRQRRLRRVRSRLQGKTRLQVHRSAKHIFAQVIATDGKILASASTLEKALRQDLEGNKTARAAIVGKAVAERAQKAGVKEVSFDRGGFQYHGRIKALADAAREQGLVF